MRRRRPEHRANERQLDDVRAELHRAVDFAVDAYPTLNKQAREMGRGFPSGSMSYGGAGGSPVEAAAFADDPAGRANDWLAEFDETRGHLLRLAGTARGLLPADPAELEKARGRQNSVEVCAECGDPIPDKVRRIDGLPFHATSCYYRVRRSS